MESEITQLWRLVMWGLGICATGFFILCGWMWGLSKKINDSVVLKESLIKISTSIEKIEIALLGGYDNPKGLMHKHDDLKNKHEDLRKRVDNLEGKQ